MTLAGHFEYHESVSPPPLRALHRALTHGQESEEAARVMAQWDAHFADARSDASVTPKLYRLEVLSSACRHVQWRLTQRPNSALSVGMLFCLIAVVAAAMVTTSIEFPARVNLYLALGGLMVGMTLIRWPRQQPRWAMVSSLFVLMMAFVAYVVALVRLGRSDIPEYSAASLMAGASFSLLAAEFLFRDKLRWFGFVAAASASGLFTLIGLQWFYTAVSIQEMFLTSVVSLCSGSVTVMLFRLRSLR